MRSRGRGGGGFWEGVVEVRWRCSLVAVGSVVVEGLVVAARLVVVRGKSLGTCVAFSSGRAREGAGRGASLTDETAVVADLSPAAEVTRACTCGGDGSSSSESDDISMGSLLLFCCWDEGAFACGCDVSSASESNISMISLLSGFFVSEGEDIVAAARCWMLRW